MSDQKRNGDKEPLSRRSSQRGRKPSTEPSGEAGTAPERGRLRTISGRSGAGGGGIGEQASGISTPTSEGSTPGGSPDRDVEERMKQLRLIELPTRPGYGGEGQKIALFTNHYDIFVPKDLVVFQYYVDVAHDRIKLNRDEKRECFWRTVNNNSQIFRNVYGLCFDGDHICISTKELAFPRGAESNEFSYQLQIRLPRMNRREIIRVRFMLVGTVSVQSNRSEQPATEDPRHSSPMNILDILFRQGRSVPPIESSKMWYPFGPTVYRIQPGSDLGCGQVIWQGLFGSTHYGDGYTPLINFDVANSSFYKNQPVLNYLVDVLNAKCSGGRNIFSLGQLTGETKLALPHLQAFNKEMKGVRIIHRTIPRAGGDPYDKEYRVNSVSTLDATACKFKMGPPDGQKREVSVAKYFAMPPYNCQLRHPKLGLLEVGSKTKPAYLPMERCTIMECQRMAKKLSPDQTSNMIKAAALPAPQRQRRIQELVFDSRFDQDKWLREYGVRVNTNMKKVEARILRPPQIGYAPVSTGGPPTLVNVKDGVWDQRGKKFFVAAGIENIGAMVITERDESQIISQFFGLLLSTCADYGMRVPREIPGRLICTLTPSPSMASDIEARMRDFKRFNVDLVIVVLPSTSHPTCYADVKRAAEIVCGVMSQCVALPTIKKAVPKSDRMVTGNIALKMNAKLGGVDWKPNMEATAKKVLTEKPTLVLGVDVSHPGPTDRKSPSISAVVGNLDSTFMRYGASVSIQKHRREPIVYLHDPVRERLTDYFNYQTTLAQKQQGKPPGPIQKPERIIIFRDGVAEGQFQELLRNELMGVREACKNLDTCYKPSITFIVGQKRHHTRFFPESGNQACGKAMNVFPGTVVEKGIAHPRFFEFFLCSHFGIQGTSCPVRYHILSDDSKFTADEIQAVTFYMTHCFTRCTRSVSIPAPLYYADLACTRARAHIQDKVDFSSDTMSRSEETGETKLSESELERASILSADLKLRMYFT